MTDDPSPTGPLAERRLPDGRRRINLRGDERSRLARQEMIERAVALFLDLERGRTWAEIASELGISVVTLKKLTKEKEFEEVYNQHFVELGHDPRLQATKAALVDLLPLAVRRLKGLLTEGTTPPTVLLNAIKEVMHYNGLAEAKGAGSDKRELADFLKEANVQIGEVNLNQTNIVPAEYRQYVDDLQQPIEGEFSEKTDDVQ